MFIFIQSHKRRAVGLLIVLFTMGMVGIALVGVMNTVTSQLTARRNSEDYERALYLAGAGVNHALAELEEDSSYATDITRTPATGPNYYTAQIAHQPDDTVIVTGVGVAGAVTRRLEATIDFGG